jgi:hypothetical protein
VETTIVILVLLLARDRGIIVEMTEEMTVEMTEETVIVSLAVARSLHLDLHTMPLVIGQREDLQVVKLSSL